MHKKFLFICFSIKYKIKIEILLPSCFIKSRINLKYILISLLVTQRFGIPSAVVESVNAFAPRTWWSDNRTCCWCHVVQLDGTWDHYLRKMSFMECDSSNVRKVQKLLCSSNSPSLFLCGSCDKAILELNGQEQMVGNQKLFFSLK